MANIQNSVNQLLSTGQWGLAFATQTPAIKEKSAARTYEAQKVITAKETADKYMAEDLDTAIDNLTKSKKMVGKSGKERESVERQYLEDRYRNISAAHNNAKQLVKKHPQYAEKYNPFITESGKELKRIRGIQEERGYKNIGRKKAKEAVQEKIENTGMAQDFKASLENMGGPV